MEVQQEKMQAVVGQFGFVAASLPRQMAAWSRLYIKLTHYNAGTGSASLLGTAPHAAPVPLGGTGTC